MKYTFGALITDGYGKLGGQVFTKNHYGNFIKTKVTPTNPQSSAQLAVRNNFTNCVQAWQTITENQRKSWILASSNYPQKNRFGQTHYLSGYGLFVKCNQARLNLGLTLLSEPTVDIEFPAWQVVDFKAFSISNKLFLFVYPALSSGYSIQLYATEQLSQGVSYVHSKWRQIGYISTPQSYPTDISSLYFAKFSATLTPGMRIFLKVSIVDNASGIITNSCIIYSDIVDNTLLALGNTWTNLGQQFSQTAIYSLCILDNGVVLAGTGNSAYVIRSTNEGVSFSNVATMTGSTRVSSFLDVGNGIVLCGTYTAGYIYRSTDYGLTWTQITIPVTSTTISSFVMSAGNAILCTSDTGGYILKSTDNGLSWVILNTITSISQLNKILYLGNSTILVGSTAAAKLFRSTDNGITFNEIATGFSGSSMGSLVYLGYGIVLCWVTVDKSLIRSTDYGLTWVEITTPFTGGFVPSCVYVGNGVLLATAFQTSSVLKSTDYGLTWTVIATTFAQSFNYTIISDNTNYALIGCGTPGLILRSTI